MTAFVAVRHRSVSALSSPSVSDGRARITANKVNCNHTCHHAGELLITLSCAHSDPLLRPGAQYSHVKRATRRHQSRINGQGPARPPRQPPSCCSASAASRSTSTQRARRCMLGR
jgi:hypothetical protein